MKTLLRLSALFVLGLLLSSCIGGGTSPSTYTAQQVMSGTVTDNSDSNQPLAGIPILVGDSVETTNADGEWQAAFSGSTVVRPQSDEYTFTPVDITVDEPCEEVNFVGTLKGTDDSSDDSDDTDDAAPEDPDGEDDADDPGDGDDPGDAEDEDSSDSGDQGSDSDDSGTDDTEEPVEASLEGRVRFANTPLPLYGTVTVSDQRATTNAGQFALTVPTGSHTYTLNTLMGEASGTLQHNGTDFHTLVFPEFPGWSTGYFDQIMMWNFGNSTYAIRWPRHKTIAVWIQPPTVSPRVGSQHVAMAWDVLEEWQSEANHPVTFSRVATERQADLRWYWGMPANFNSAGLCRVFINHQRYITESEIYISLNHLDHRGIYLHEAGHSIGLAHSPDSSEIMYPIVHSHSLREREISAAQLLYSIPTGTEPLETVQIQALGTTPVAVEKGPDGTWITIE